MANEGEETVSLLDVIEEEKELQDAANAVLGGADDSNCTYSSGYVKRQAIYACASCSSKPNAICFACSLHCHEGHELYELYTKRNLRCDCGVENVLPQTCRLLQDKERVNSKNVYNHNFQGRYCTCDRPYPDSEDEVEDEMIQCIACEDWFHSRHLNCIVPAVYEEMVCGGCMERLSFLRNYRISCLGPVESDCVVELGTSAGTNVASPTVPTDHSSTAVKRTPLDKTSLVTDKPSSTSDSFAASSNTTNDLGVDSTSGGDIVVQFPNANSSQLTYTEPDSSTSNNAGIEESSIASAAVPSQSDVTSSSQLETDSSAADGKALSDKEPLTCFLKKARVYASAEDSSNQKGAAFFLEGWRSSLCCCPLCKEMYAKEKVNFLCDPEDTIAAYESCGRGEECDIHDAGMAVLTQQLSRVEQVEMIHEFNFMKERLKNYLKKFAEEDKVVAARNIDEFFGDLKAHKRRRLENGEGLPPGRCR